jgi:chromosome segregation ATPase
MSKETKELLQVQEELVNDLRSQEKLIDALEDQIENLRSSNETQEEIINSLENQIDNLNALSDSQEEMIDAQDKLIQELEQTRNGYKLSSLFHVCLN